MTSGYILIVAILVLGGVIATLGDRIGTRVGKARLSLFNLRPRKTATLVTILTGSLISTLTLGILLATSGSLRDGIFELDRIKRNLRLARADVDRLNTQKSQVESELETARTQQAEVQKRLETTRQSFQRAQTQLKNISKQANDLRTEIKSLLTERRELIERRNQLSAERQELIEQRNQLSAERQDLIEQRNQLNTQVSQLRARVTQRDKELVQQDQAIAERDQVIAQRESRLQELQQQLQEAIAQREIRLQELEQQLVARETQIIQQDKQLEEREKQLAFLEREVQTLEQYYQNYQALRQGNVALVRGQVLAFGVVRIVDPQAANQAVDQLLREANRAAMEAAQVSNTDSNEPLVQITQTQVEQLINQIRDGQDYVVRILSAGNYVVGEKPIQVFADAAINQLVFQEGEVLAAVSADPSTMANEEIRRRLEQLLAASQFRARRAGILGDIQVADGRITTIIRFLEQLDEYDQPLDVRAVAQGNTSTAGPLIMQLVAVQNGQVVFST